MTSMTSARAVVTVGVDPHSDVHHAAGTPKTRDGRVEAIRTLRVARRSAIKGRTQAINQLEALVLTGPAGLRQALAGQSTRQLLATCRGCG